MNTIVIDNVGGWCPCQGEGTINGKPFYFRARHGEWTFDIAETFDDAIDGAMSYSNMPTNPRVYYHASGDDPDEGYMSPEEAERIIREEASKWQP